MLVSSGMLMYSEDLKYNCELFLFVLFRRSKRDAFIRTGDHIEDTKRLRFDGIIVL